MDTGLRARRHCFELGGGAIAEGRMLADLIIEYFDPFEDFPFWNGVLGARKAPSYWHKERGAKSTLNHEVVSSSPWCDYSPG